MGYTIYNIYYIYRKENSDGLQKNKGEINIRSRRRVTRVGGCWFHVCRVIVVVVIIIIIILCRVATIKTKRIIKSLPRNITVLYLRIIITCYIQWRELGGSTNINFPNP